MLYYGASYYPEQETWEEIQSDVHVIRRAGFNIVRMGEFAWTKFEPSEGKYDFEWLDRVVELLGQIGVQTLMCTPTANPPIWMVEKHPEILYVDNRGVIRPFGGRRHYCYTNPVYRAYSEKIAAAIGEHYGSNPHIIGFHIDNEFGQEGTGRCQCAECKQAFRRWLAEKYGDISSLNERMGTIFWSQTYERFDQINPPVHTIENDADQLIDRYYDNPSLRLDFERFSSDSIIEFQNIQRDAIKKHSKKPVTNNVTGVWTNAVNYYDSFNGLDIVSQNEYSPLRGESMYTTNHSYAFIRGILRKNFWVTETRSGGGQCVWARQGILQPYPGALKQHAVYTYVSGSEAYIYFQMKTFRYGAEQQEAAVLDVDGVEGRRFKEFTEVSSTLPVLEKYLTGTVNNDIAICYDYDSHWAIKIKPFSKDFVYQKFAIDILASLSIAGYNCDVIPPGNDIFKYKLVILPAQVIMSESFKDTLKNYVKQGGTVIATFLTAIKDPDNCAPRAHIPADLCDLFGMRVTEGEPVLENTVSTITLSVDGKTVTGQNLFWTESLEPAAAEIIARYDDTFRKGEAVIARNKYGDGTAFYMGCGLEPDLLGAFAAYAASLSGTRRVPFELCSGVEVLERCYEGKPLYCIFNFLDIKTDITADGTFADLLTGETFACVIPIDAKGYRFLSPL